MGVVVTALVVVVGLLVYLNLRAHGIVRKHSRTLAARTGIPARQIQEEMVRGRLTPGEWAAIHGLDPLTFEPLQPSPAQAEAMLARLWNRIRLDPTAGMPDADRMERIGELQSELARLLAAGPPLPSQLTRQCQILVELYDLGTRVDAQWVNDTLLRTKALAGAVPDLAGGGPRSQAEYDEWQIEQVRRRDRGELSIGPPSFESSGGFG